MWLLVIVHNDEQYWNLHVKEKGISGIAANFFVFQKYVLKNSRESRLPIHIYVHFMLQDASLPAYCRHQTMIHRNNAC